MYIQIYFRTNYEIKIKTLYTFVLYQLLITTLPLIKFFLMKIYVSILTKHF